MVRYRVRRTATNIVLDEAGMTGGRRRITIRRDELRGRRELLRCIVRRLNPHAMNNTRGYTTNSNYYNMARDLLGNNTRIININQRMLTSSPTLRERNLPTPTRSVRSRFNQPPPRTQSTENFRRVPSTRLRRIATIQNLNAYGRERPRDEFNDIVQRNFGNFRNQQFRSFGDILARAERTRRNMENQNRRLQTMFLNIARGQNIPVRPNNSEPNSPRGVLNFKNNNSNNNRSR